MKIVLAACLLFAGTAAAELRAGFGVADITPAVGDGEKKVWIAGYGQGRSATGVHDPLFARAVVLEDSAAGRKLALVSVDLVGLQRPAVVRVREQLEGFDHVLISSTHNHEGPDVIGIWGQSPLRSGVDPKYIELVVTRCVEAVRSAEKALAPAIARYGTAEDESLIHDSRLPVVIDGKLHALSFLDPETKEKRRGTLLVWSCHPEAMGPNNREITADFLATTIAVLEEKLDSPIAAFIGSIGGLMAPPVDRIRGADGQLLPRHNWEYTERLGAAVADLALEAIEASAPIELTPIRLSSEPVMLPVDNTLYRTAYTAGILEREAFVYEKGGKRGPAFRKLKHTLKRMAVETEIGYLQLGELGVAAIPGELYPELLEGEFQDPADPGADFPRAALEPTIASMMPTEKWLVLGCAYDEIGYIIPRRQWDAMRPFAYGRDKAQYGELNSCGPETAGIVMRALGARVRAVTE